VREFAREETVEKGEAVVELQQRRRVIANEIRVISGDIAYKTQADRRAVW
jgi:hypothetical protein